MLYALLFNNKNIFYIYKYVYIPYYIYIFQHIYTNLFNHQIKVTQHINQETYVELKLFSLKL